MRRRHVEGLRESLGSQVVFRLGGVGRNITVITDLSPLAGLKLLIMAKFRDEKKAC
jgi:hypothetical protein